MRLHTAQGHLLNYGVAGRMVRSNASDNSYRSDSCVDKFSQ